MTPSDSDIIYRKDYTPFGYCIDKVDLEFLLSPSATRVKSQIAFRPNPLTNDRTFFLHGENLTLHKTTIDGTAITPVITDQGLTYDAPLRPFTFAAEVEIDPKSNTALEGLYMSNGMYATQCEAEGFRKITFYPDRPDVMAPFTVRITGPRDTLPILLSNGNPVEKGTTGPDSHFTVWHDPWPKPAYLFALVAGNLVNHSDVFTTASGDHVALNIWVRPGDEHKCAFAMQSLKKAMRWDEDIYGREYDLETFNIVAVDDFNMGAMENKGLNIFNSSAVLVSPETATDTAFERVEAIIAHEYFHNWTGNRVTCRDWFQLCLKEGLTVYRDSQFTSDMRSAPVKRINDVIELRTRQFPEDQGPLSHPVRPDQFKEINNFYTATVYEKGAEVIGMLKRLVGDDNYAKALDLYFERHDGHACTIEDWLKVFEDVAGIDLTQFKRWYSQSGTPRLTVLEDWHKNTYSLTFSQHTEASVTTPDPKPFVIPICIGLLSSRGEEITPTTLFKMTEATQTITFENLSARPIPSILREFSAPVALERANLDRYQSFLLTHDTDPFNRWEAGRTLAQSTLIAMSTSDSSPDEAYIDALHSIIGDDRLEPAYRAQMLQLPGQADLANSIAQSGMTPDPLKIYHATETFRQTLAQHCRGTLFRIYEECDINENYEPNAEQSGRRSLLSTVLSLITHIDGGALAREHHVHARNMTQQLSSLSCLITANIGTEYVEAFYRQWRQDRIVLTKWFMLQVLQSKPEKTASTVRTLSTHPDFNVMNPNIFRSVFGSLAMNHAGFHADDGSGYALLADWLIELDPINPQTAARLCTAYQAWRNYDADRQALMCEALHRIDAAENRSSDTKDMIDRLLGR